MANEEQLSILRQGVEVWNRWRVENRNTRIDLREADLTRAELTVVLSSEITQRNRSQLELLGSVLT